METGDLSRPSAVPEGEEMAGAGEDALDRRLVARVVGGESTRAVREEYRE